MNVKASDATMNAELNAHGIDKLVEEAKRTHIGKDRQRQAREATYKFMSVTAGNEPGFEDATRALFAGDRARFAHSISGWPADVRKHASKLADSAFA